MVLITIVTGAYKPTYNWGASHCVYIYIYLHTGAKFERWCLWFMDIPAWESKHSKVSLAIYPHCIPIKKKQQQNVIYHHVCCLISLNPTRLHFLLLKSIFSYLITPLYYSIHSIPSLKHQKSLRPVTPVRAKHKLQKVDVYYKTHLQSVKLWVKQS